MGSTIDLTKTLTLAEIGKCLDGWIRWWEGQRRKYKADPEYQVRAGETIATLQAVRIELLDEPLGLTKEGKAVRPAVRRFAEEMERQLARHDGDYGTEGWVKSPKIWLLGRLLQKVAELTMDIGANVSGTTDAAHVANFAMMIADQEFRQVGGSE